MIFDMNQELNFSRANSTLLVMRRLHQFSEKYGRDQRLTSNQINSLCRRFQVGQFFLMFFVLLKQKCGINFMNSNYYRHGYSLENETMEEAKQRRVSQMRAWATSS